LESKHGARTFAREIILNAGTGNTSTALALFRNLCEKPDADNWSVRNAAEALTKAGLTNRALRILKEVLGGKACNRYGGAVAIQLLTDELQTLRAVYHFGQIHSAEARTRAAPVLDKGLGKLKARLSLQILLWRYREEFSRDDQAWGKVGSALILVKRRRSVATWMADWRPRPNVETWMLFNFCLAHRERGRYQEASEVARYAVQKWESGRQKGADVRLFLLVEEAFAGSLEEAIENLWLVQARANVRYDQQLLAIGFALVETRQSSSETRRQQFRSIRKQLDVAFPAEKHCGPAGTPE
jgi:Arc/MetJ-type ribon-helix-helix transcriptional regulator